MIIFDDQYYMKQALKEALKAFEKDEVPVGAVIVSNDKIIARSHNLTERLNDSTAHAEMQCITSASHYLGHKYLTDCTIYVTLEPCTMCAGALYHSQMSKVVYGAEDSVRGFKNCGVKLHPKTEIVSGVLSEESSYLLKSFFLSKR